jgi:chemotaxis protein methyltransferase CheR
MKYKITDSELSKICEVIAARLGLNFPGEKWAMLRRSLALAALEFGFHDLSKFVQWLVTTSLGRDQIEILASYLTIGETYFWREPHVFAAFSQNALKELIASRKGREKRINIWCAACSTGEEAYSIAIALHRTIPEIKDWKIIILASDINAKALSIARSGIYGSWSFRNSPSWFKSGYFKKINNKEYEVIPEIKEMVTFSSFNLTRENYLSSICGNHKMDIIFCRNVLMYLTDEWTARVSANLFHSLSEDGWLVVSSCELSSILFPQLTPVNFPGAVLYHKNKKEELLSLQATQPLQFLQHSSTFILQSPGEGGPSTLQQYPTIIKPAKKSVTDKIFAIRSLADQGLLEESLSTCNEAIASDKLTPGLYFLRASILQELDKSLEAIKSLKQAIYIYPDYIMGHFTLGNIFFRHGNFKNSRLYFNTALELLNRIPGNDIPAESEGLSAKNLMGIILSNLQTQKTV